MSKGLNSKKKGNRVEREFAKAFNDRFNLKDAFRRVPMSGAWTTNNINTDVRQDAKEILSGDLIVPTNFKFSIECKGRAEFNFWDMLNDDTKHLEIDDWIIQAQNDASISGKEPLLLIKVNNRKPFALFPVKLKESNIRYKDFTIMRFDYLLKLDEDFFFKEE